ncbi:hypothetical protein HMPREF0580_2345 [Mobiluncus mulieris ATCC 35239]|uniref:Uncharacterized protein n=1 Tax=Mobiluncus mulieris ATCC 35239 TaxID=871571 RepID=E0QTY0_9ACTO|nr:hypothetical protein HMPREF0577_1705 [Mobiluncus mulieris ATCC 35243]EFM44981.1 hypothetical protein HMPREF0580_2345 [Mobiluncus mulieris ATCC 35239]
MNNCLRSKEVGDDGADGVAFDSETIVAPRVARRSQKADIQAVIR